MLIYGNNPSVFVLSYCCGADTFPIRHYGYHILIIKCQSFKNCKAIFCRIDC